ncbi:MAG: sugar-binding domain-containing protein [Planctomycetota bacterium]
MARYPTYVNLASETRKRLDLAGRWHFRLDPKKQGLAQKWFLPGRNLRETIRVPGTWQTQGFGKERSRAHDRYGSAVAPKHQYLGDAWYKRTFRVPGEWLGKRVWLKIAGVNPSCDVWVNGWPAGKCRHPGVPAAFDITAGARPGAENDITIRVHEANRGLGMWYNLMTFWSGLWGDVQIEATARTWIDDLFVVPDVDNSRAVLRGRIGGAGEAEGRLTLEAEVFPARGNGPRDRREVRLTPGRNATFEAAVPLQDVRLWSPEDPFLYRARLVLRKNGEIVDSASTRFGMRKLEARGARLYLNNRPLYVRGCGDDGMYPLTLCPERDGAELRRRFRLIKSYGFNSVYPCAIMQPEEYLDAADETGVLIQYNIGALLAFERKGGPGAVPDVSAAERRRLVEEQWRAVLQWTQNHPSIAIYAPGSELSGRGCKRLYHIARRKDPTRFILSWAEGVGDRSATDVISLTQSLYYTEDASEELHTIIDETVVPWKNPEGKPGLLHEYCGAEALPDPRLTRMYRQGHGLTAKKEIAVEKDLRALGLTGLTGTLVANSRKIANSCRKMVMEEARKARGISGYYMWLIQDIPGYPQGLFDPFWKPKDIAAREFSKSNGETVLLMNEPSCETRRCFPAGARVRFDILISHQTEKRLRRGAMEWNLLSRTDGRPLLGGRVSGIRVKPFAAGRLCSIAFTAPAVKKATAAEFRVSLRNGGIRIENNWNLWLYPGRSYQPPVGKVCLYADNETTRELGRCFPSMDPWRGTMPEVVITNRLDEKTLPHLAKGGTVVLLQSGNRKLLPTQFFPRWPMTDGGLNINATVVKNHPLMAAFPHEGFCDYQFYHLIMDPRTKPDVYSDYRDLVGVGGVAFGLEGIRTRIQPIIRVYHRKANAAYMFEARVGQGRLLATTLRLAETVNLFPESAYLFERVLRYVTGNHFDPKTRLAPGEMSKLGLVQH